MNVNLKTLACMQLAQLINKGKWVEECKAEWYSRWKIDYTFSRIKK